MDGKACTQCGLTKSYTSFNKHARSKDGLASDCQECHRKYWTMAIHDPAKRSERLRRKKARYYANHDQSLKERNDYRNRKRQENIRLFKLKLMLRAAKGRSRQKGWPFDSSVEQFPELDSIDNCPVFPWISIAWDNAHGDTDTSPTIDRIDNEGFYVEGNVRIISMLANIAKKDLTTREIIALLQDCVKNQNLSPEEHAATKRILQFLLP